MSLVELGDPPECLLLNHAKFLLVSANLVVVVGIFLQLADEFEIMGDDYELELPIIQVHLNEPGKFLGEVVDMGAVEVGGRFVEGEHAGGVGEDLGQRNADDDGGQHLLAH